MYVVSVCVVCVVGTFVCVLCVSCVCVCVMCMLCVCYVCRAYVCVRVCSIQCGVIWRVQVLKDTWNGFVKLLRCRTIEFLAWICLFA